eukprot:1823677-Rhodomonas_salina.1
MTISRRCRSISLMSFPTPSPLLAIHFSFSLSLLPTPLLHPAVAPPTSPRGVSMFVSVSVSVAVAVTVSPRSAHPLLPVCTVLLTPSLPPPTHTLLHPTPSSPRLPLSLSFSRRCWTA